MVTGSFVFLLDTVIVDRDPKFIGYQHGLTQFRRGLYDLIDVAVGQFFFRKEGTVFFA